MKEKLLILCYRAPYPLQSGSEIRMYQFIEVLSKYYEVDVLYLQESDNKEIVELNKICNRVEGFKVSKLLRLLQAGIGYCFKGWSLQQGYFYSTKMQKWIDEHLDDYSKVLCMHIRSTTYLLNMKPDRLEGVDVYFDGIDAISLNYYNSYLASSGIKRLIYRIEYMRMKKVEKQAYTMFKRNILISERDRDYITTELGVNSEPAVIYNYAIDFGYQPQVEKDKCTIAFMGKMNYKPNVDAILHFVNHIYDDLKQAYPQLQLNIIGGSATEEIKALEKKDGIHVCGFVDNPAKLLQEATLVIAPMVSGSGLQNKIIQAMYLACTVVTTKIGADGLTNISGKEIVVAEDDKDMYQKLSYYLDEKNASERMEIGQNARDYVEKTYSYRRIEEQIKHFFLKED